MKPISKRLARFLNSVLLCVTGITVTPLLIILLAVVCKILDWFPTFYNLVQFYKVELFQLTIFAISLSVVTLVATLPFLGRPTKD